METTFSSPGPVYLNSPGGDGLAGDIGYPDLAGLLGSPMGVADEGLQRSGRRHTDWQGKTANCKCARAGFCSRRVASPAKWRREGESEELAAWLILEHVGVV